MNSHLLLSLSAAGLLLSGCAGVRVSSVQTAAVVTQRPSAIYIEPFSVESAEFTGRHPGGSGERPLRKSLAPIEFASALKEELEKLAPARILQPDEVATQGWLVEGTIDRVHGGSPTLRALGPGYLNPLGRSRINIHVRVLDLDHRTVRTDDKADGTLRQRGHIIYEFDLDGGSRLSGANGSSSAPGLGSAAASFDYRNAAERVRVAIEPDQHRYGARYSTNVR